MLPIHCLPLQVMICVLSPLSKTKPGTHVNVTTAPCVAVTLSGVALVIRGTGGQRLSTKCKKKINYYSNNNWSFLYGSLSLFILTGLYKVLGLTVIVLYLHI